MLAVATLELLHAAAVAAPPLPMSWPTVSTALQLNDAWETTLYESVCFERRKWLLLASSSLRPAQYRSAHFSRFPLRLHAVGGSMAEELARRRAGCWRGGVTFVADLRHYGGATMGIAHFAKRLLRLYGLQRAGALPEVARVAFPATSAAHLAHSWPSAMLRLVAPNAEVPPRTFSAQFFGAILRTSS